MNITTFLRDTLGAKLKARWSWGAVDAANRIFLLVWADNQRNSGHEVFVKVLNSAPSSKSAGYRERRSHLESIRNGAEAFGVLCIASDPTTTASRNIARFDQERLLRLGKITEESDGTYAAIVGRVPVGDLVPTKSDSDLIAEDIREIYDNATTTTTTKEALVSARIGQGKFREDVLHSWGRCCAVTGVSFEDVIRASHIKPWKDSTNYERLDPNNGIALTANFDALFDRGCISFSDCGSLIVSPRITLKDREALGVKKISLLHEPPDSMKEYLRFHRKKWNLLQPGETIEPPATVACEVVR